MRTRTTTEQSLTRNRGPFTWTSYGLPQWIQNGSGTASPGGTYVESEGESVITDDPSPSQQAKTVDHRIRHLSRRRIDHYDEFTSTNRYVYNGSGAHWYSWGSYGAIRHGNVTVTYPATIAQLRTKAMHDFYNRNQVDNLLNIVESPQLIASIRSLDDLIRKIRAGKIYQLKQNVDSRPLFSRKLPNFSSLDLANVYLMWQFGFAPLISDMIKCMKSVKTLRSDMNRAVSDAGKQYTVTAKCDGVVSINGTALDPLTGFSNSYNPPNSSWWHAEILNQSGFHPVRIVGVSGVRTFKYSMASFQKLDYLMARFLSPGPISYLWERIPFSFVVDWFVNLSGIIDSLNNTLTGGTKKIKRCWWSEKYHINARAIKHATSVWNSDSDGSPTVDNVLSYYHREALPVSIVPTFSGRFGKKQATLSGALLRQLVANLKR